MTDQPSSSSKTLPEPGDAANDVRSGQPPPDLSREAFAERFRAMFYDPAFERDADAFASIEATAWAGYHAYRKSPRTEKAGEDSADPDFDLPIEWRRTRDELLELDRVQRDPATPRRILLICASPRSEHTCPGESSKTWRLLEAVREVAKAGDVEVDVLELNRLTSEYGRRIFPCKGCVSTAMPLCHWPCSCYPNHALGQVNDWMAEIYPRWVAAHGVMIVTPVHWYQAPSVLKLMMDRLVCADGGNPDPTSTHGKKPKLAKALEMKGWDYPRHLAGRIFSVIVHGDTEGTDIVRRSLTDWLLDLQLIEAGAMDRYIGYYGPYATSHKALDKDKAIQQETKNAARTLVEAVALLRKGKLPQPGRNIEDPRPK